MWGFWYCIGYFGSNLGFGKSKGNYIYCSSEVLVNVTCLVLLVLWVGIVLVVFTYDQRRSSAIFAQASPSRLSESCRVSCLYLGSRFSPLRPGVRVERLVSRSGESHSPKRGCKVTWVFWAQNLVQARSCVGLSEPGCRSGETASPKRDVVVMCDALLAF